MPHDDHDHRSHDFDEMAATWDDDPTKVERAQVVAAMLVERLAPTSATRVLEYGAGTGLVGQALAPHVGPLTLADPSQGMRAAMAAKVADGRLPADARVVALQLDQGAVPTDRFDLVVTVQVMHHVADVAPVLAGFHQVLAPGGHLAVVDLEAEDGSFHGEGYGVHHGFDREVLGAQLAAAGFSDVTFEHAYDLVKDGRPYPLFLALARR